MQSVISVAIMGRQATREKRQHEYQEKMNSIMKSGSSAHPFSEYLKRNDVFEVLQPALTLLYEMPIKPIDLNEYFAEFLDNGAQTLLKISLLQAELLYKQNQVRDKYV